MKEMAPKPDHPTAILSEEQLLFGLEDWKIICLYAQGQQTNELERKEAKAAIYLLDTPKTAKIIIHPLYVTDNVLRDIIDHELGHLVINPGQSAPTGYELEHAQACHLARACKELRTHPEEYALETGNLDEIIKKARKLTWLDENEWRIVVESKKGIYSGGTRYPMLAESQYHEDRGHLGSLCARQVTLYLDENFIAEKELSLPNLVLEEMWRIVLNPYQKPTRNGVQDHQVKHIMKIMKRLGWEKGGLYE